MAKLRFVLTVSLAVLPLVRPAAGQDVSTSTSQAAAASDKDRVQKIAEAGVQFEVPKGWKLETKPGSLGDGYRLISPDGGATIAFIPAYEHEADDRLDAIRDAAQLDAKSFKAGEEKTETINGLTCTVRSDTVDNGDTVLITGLIRSKKPVIFIRTGDKASMQTHAATLDRIFRSVKATE